LGRYIAVGQARDDGHLLVRGDERRAACGHAARLAGFVTWEIDAETLRIVYDTGLAHLFGLDPGQVAESLVDFVARIHPDDLEPTLEALKAAKVPGAATSPNSGWAAKRRAGAGFVVQARG
jgi:hypothetical protein